MKRFVLGIVFLCLASTTSFAAKHVNGYYKKDGTYVQPYYKSDPNGTPTDNYSFKGNINPYTGKEGQNYYKNDPQSPYYTGGSGLGGYQKKWK